MRLLHYDEMAKERMIPDSLFQETCEDLELERLAAKLSLNIENPLSTDDLVSMLTSDAKEIRRRQEISYDLFNNQKLYNDMIEIHDKLVVLHSMSEDRASATDKSLKNFVFAVDWIYHFCSTMNMFASVFDDNKNSISSSLLLDLGLVVKSIVQSEEFMIVEKNINELKKTSSSIRSLRMGVNLNEYLEPISVNCLDASELFWQPRRIVDIGSSDKRKQEGIGKFRYIPRGKVRDENKKYDHGMSPVVLANASTLQRFATCEIDVGFIRSIDSFFDMFNFNCRNAVRLYILEKASEVFEVIYDIGFFLGGVAFAKRLEEKGMPVCQAVAGDEGTHTYIADELYNCYLPYKIEDPENNIVKNSINLSDKESFAILNGPNKGGKTTFIQAMSINLLLFQLGLYSTCSKATITPADKILTHYQRSDQGTLAGRLEKEMNSINRIFLNITDESMVFFNEPYVSTSPSEGMDLILELVKAVSAIGCRGFLVTHYHRINDAIEDLNNISRNKVLFMNMGIDVSKDDRKRTYELKKGRGEVKSFAKDILREYAPEILD